MSDFTERLVIKENFTSDDVDFVSMQRGWILKRAQKEEAGAYIDIWITPDRQTQIHQVDDRPIGTRYFTLHGPGSEEVAQHIREDCELWSTEEALRALREATDRREKMVCVYAAALAADRSVGEAVAQEFRVVIRDLDPGVRQSVVIATGYFPHPGLVTLVEEIRDNDPVEQVRRNAQILLDGLQLQHPPETGEGS